MLHLIPSHKTEFILFFNLITRNKKKVIMKSGNEMYKVLEPLVNQMLFGHKDKPVFSLLKYTLSNEFTSVCNQIKDGKESEGFLKQNIMSVFKDF